MTEPVTVATASVSRSFQLSSRWPEPAPASSSRTLTSPYSRRRSARSHRRPSRPRPQPAGAPPAPRDSRRAPRGAGGEVRPLRRHEVAVVADRGDVRDVAHQRRARATGLTGRRRADQLHCLDGGLLGRSPTEQAPWPICASSSAASRRPTRSGWPPPRPPTRPTMSSAPSRPAGAVRSGRRWARTRRSSTSTARATAPSTPRTGA